jgi:hypothetical protein
LLRQSWAAAQALKAPDDPSAEGAQRGLEAAEQHQLAAAGQAQPVAMQMPHSSSPQLLLLPWPLTLLAQRDAARLAARCAMLRPLRRDASSRASCVTACAAQLLLLLLLLALRRRRARAASLLLCLAGTAQPCHDWLRNLLLLLKQLPCCGSATCITASCMLLPYSGPACCRYMPLSPCCCLLANAAGDAAVDAPLLVQPAGWSPQPASIWPGSTSSASMITGQPAAVRLSW